MPGDTKTDNSKQCILQQGQVVERLENKNTVISK